MKAFDNNKAAIRQPWLRAILYIILCYLLLTTATFVLQMIAGPKPGEEPDARMVYVSVVVYAAISLVFTWLFMKVIDRQPITVLGFATKKNGDHAIVGFSLGILLLSVGSLILYASGSLSWTGIDFDGLDLFSGLMLMIIVAIYEEVVFRGYLLHNLLQSFNKWVALLITAVLFALAHSNNPAITPLAAVNIFAAGLLLGVNYIYTRNLWFAIMFHFSWNFFQGPVLGYQVSGAGIKSVLTQELKGDSSITGGPFGLEGSVVALLLYILAIAAFIWVYERQYTPKKIVA